MIMLRDIKRLLNQRGTFAAKKKLCLGNSKGKLEMGIADIHDKEMQEERPATASVIGQFMVTRRWQCVSRSLMELYGLMARDGQELCVFVLVRKHG